jgi:hypothetical protein
MVSLATLVTATLAPVACLRVPPPVGQDASAPRPAFRFDNSAQTWVDVYLVSEVREWRLGRVGPGAKTDLRLPDDALSGEQSFMRLAVIVGGPWSMRAARDPRSIFTMAQPASELAAQRWSFVQQSGEPAQLLSIRAAPRR